MKKENIFEIEKESSMNTSGKIFASEKLLEAIKKDNAIEQVKNVAKLPGILGSSLAMPDCHLGYGFPIGGVAAFDIESGVISPGGVGFDINCGVRLVKTNLNKEDFEDSKTKKEVMDQLFRDIPTGVGRKGRITLTNEELDEVLLNGASWAVENGYGKISDLENIESNGKIPNASPKMVSQRAKGRGKPQLGSLGAGNHFVEIQAVDEIFDEDLAQKWNLKKDQVVIMIHTGSRGLGHQVASDYIKSMEEEYGWPEADRQLVNAPIKSELGQEYLSAMAAAANFAFANRQMIMHWTNEAMKGIFSKYNSEILYDVAHNIAKFEEHEVDGGKKEVLVMRKGATRAFPGQPIILPGSMGTASYILVGTKKAMEVSFGSTAHGAGRVYSRSYANKNFDTEKIKSELKESNIEIRAGSHKGIKEEAPNSYKDIEEVVRVSDELGIGKKVVRLKPLGVIKG